MTPHTVVLDGAGIGPLTAGGKGSALDKLAALDVRIPATGVITTSAYEAFESVPAIASFVADLKTGEIPDPTEHDEHRRLVDEVFLSAPLPDTVADEVDRLAATVASGGLVAVRSSATAEDLESASFAGQYESYLNVDAGGVHDAVRLVWASLWYPAPRAYRRFRQIDEHDLTMAVVVMQMLDPSEAGVLVHRRPGRGRRRRPARGRAGPGRAARVRRDDTRRLRHRPGDDGRGVRRPSRHRCATSPPRRSDSRRHSTHRRTSSSPSTTADLYLVQARPITTTTDDSRTDDGFDFSCGDNTTYTTAGIAEMHPRCALATLSVGHQQLAARERVPLPLRSARRRR